MSYSGQGSAGNLGSNLSISCF